MPNPIGYKTLENAEMGFLYVQLKLRLENSTQNGNMKKNVLFSPLFLYNLALITHDATKRVNPSINFPLNLLTRFDQPAKEFTSITYIRKKFI